MNVTESDLLPDGLSLDSLTSGFDPCLDVLTVARSYFRIPRLSEIVNFDWVEFLVDIIGLANDGVNCYVTMQELQGQTVPENLFGQRENCTIGLTTLFRIPFILLHDRRKVDSILQ